MTMENEPVPLTRAAYEAMQRELEELRTEGRRRVSEQIQEAREIELDQDEDMIPALEAAKESQGFIEGRIAVLEQALGNATIIDEEAVRRSDTVQIGSTVVVRGDAGERTYRVLHAAEADAAEGSISPESPIGAALLGRSAGDVVEVEAPAGTQRLTIAELR